ncbi:hypothetical protein EV182_008312, partial [Spiromyces aspiralis]
SYYFWGFRFDDICYISDCSRISDETRRLMLNSKILIIDALNWKGHSSHYSVPDALEETRLVRPGLTILTGMSHSIDHYDLEEYLKHIKKSEGLDILVAFDGQSISPQSDDLFR